MSKLIVSADELLTTDFPEPLWTIKDFLPEGLALLAGPPKIGKSWLSLQIMRAKTSGGVVMNRPVLIAPALYIALEDPRRRLKARMLKQKWRPNSLADFIFLPEFTTKIGNLASLDGPRNLGKIIAGNRYQLVVIDTLSRSITGDQNDVSAMTNALSRLQEIANINHATVLLVDHHRKNGFQNKDAIADILGSTGKPAVADTIWGLYSEKQKSGAKLLITGRDVETLELDLAMDWQIGCWQVVGTNGQPDLYQKHQDVIDLISTSPGLNGSGIASQLKIHRSNLHGVLKELEKAGILEVMPGQGNELKYFIHGFNATTSTT